VMWFGTLVERPVAIKEGSRPRQVLQGCSAARRSRKYSTRM
jgi:hypothetical protein